MGDEDPVLVWIGRVAQRTQFAASEWRRVAPEHVDGLEAQRRESLHVLRADLQSERQPHLHPGASELLSAYAVSRAVNAVANDGPELIAPSDRKRVLVRPVQFPACSIEHVDRGAASNRVEVLARCLSRWQPRRLAVEPERSTHQASCAGGEG